MTSVVNETFREQLRARLDEDYRDSVNPAAGSSSLERDLHRALLLAERAVREWATLAVTAATPGPALLERLPEITAFEQGRRIMEVAIDENPAIPAATGCRRSSTESRPSAAL